VQSPDYTRGGVTPCDPAVGFHGGLPDNRGIWWRGRLDRQQRDAAVCAMVAGQPAADRVDGGARVSEFVVL
jgi:hypothetical protein